MHRKMNSKKTCLKEKKWKTHLFGFYTEVGHKGKTQILHKIILLEAETYITLSSPFPCTDRKVLLKSAFNLAFVPLYRAKASQECDAPQRCIFCLWK